MDINPNHLPDPSTLSLHELGRIAFALVEQADFYDRKAKDHHVSATICAEEHMARETKKQEAIDRITARLDQLQPDDAIAFAKANIPGFTEEVASMSSPLSVVSGDIVPLHDQAFHVEGIKTQHKAVKAAETSAAVAAWFAGDHARSLMSAYGWSMRRVANETGIPNTTVQRYVAVTRARVSHRDIVHGESINDILDEKHPKERQREQRKATFGQAEAEYAVKLYRMTESPNENEASVAARKLDQFASDHGMTGEEVIEKSREKLGLTEEMVRDPMDEAIDKMMAPFKKQSKEDLVDLLLFCIIEYDGCLQKLKERLNG